MRPFFKRMLLFGLLCVLAVSLSGCFLQLALGRVVTESIGESIRVQIAAIFSRGTVAVCLDLGEDFFECTYFIDGVEVTSTFSLRTELGFFGILVDPVILQVPGDATNFEGTFDDGTGPRPVVITEVGSFEVQPGTEVFAEPGQKFVILEFPPDVPPTLPSGDPTTGDPFDFELTFDRVTSVSDPIEPITVKPMLAGKVIIDGQTFYIPLLPCVTDFSLIPEVVIPESSVMEDLQPELGDLIRGSGNVGCVDVVYDYSALDPTATPTATQTQTSTPTNTPVSTDTPTPEPTDTPSPTSTPTPRPVGGYLVPMSPLNLLAPWLRLGAGVLGFSVGAWFIWRRRMV